MHLILIEETATGWTVIQDKAKGLNKGRTTLATLCGGNLGRLLAMQCAKQAASVAMADGVTLRLLDGTESQWVQD